MKTTNPGVASILDDCGAELAAGDDPKQGLSLRPEE